MRLLCGCRRCHGCTRGTCEMLAARLTAPGGELPFAGERLPDTFGYKRRFGTVPMAE